MSGPCEVWTPAQVAEWLGVSERKVQELALEGRIPTVRIGVSWRFLPDSLDRWVRQIERPARQDADTPLPGERDEEVTRDAVAAAEAVADEAWTDADEARFLADLRSPQGSTGRSSVPGQDGATSSASTQGNKEPQRS